MLEIPNNGLRGSRPGTRQPNQRQDENEQDGPAQ
jgi:hypothetical protein